MGERRPSRPRRLDARTRSESDGQGSRIASQESVGGQELVSVITRASAGHLGLAMGDEVTAIIKSTEVMFGK
jgi:molybdopterin-binding protein